MSEEPKPLAVRDEQPESSVQAAINFLLSNPDANLGLLEGVLNIQSREKAEHARVWYAEDFVGVQAEMAKMGPIIRDAQNPHTKSWYTRLETLDEGIRSIYTKYGFSLSFNNPVTEKGNVTITCRVRHKGGHEEMYQLSAPPDTTGAKGAAVKTDIQGLGSTVSYLRRYLTLMIFNVVLKNEDKDGNLVGFVNEEQANKIIDAMKRATLTPERESKFLSMLGVKAVSEIPQREYARAMTLLEQARRKATKPMDFDEFPDPGDFQTGARISVAGTVYERAPDGNTWRPVRQ